MRIEHIAIFVRSLEQARRFWEHYFGAVSNTMYYNPKTGLKTYFMHLDDGARIELMTRQDCVDAEISPFSYGFAHIAVCVGGKSRVDELTKRLAADGFTVESEPRTTGDGYYESVILDGEGNRIELVAEK